MTLEQLKEMVIWIEGQIAYLETSIQEAQQTNNFGRKLQHEGMRNGFVNCLNKLKKYVHKRSNNKPLPNSI